MTPIKNTKDALNRKAFEGDKDHESKNQCEIRVRELDRLRST